MARKVQGKIEFDTSPVHGTIQGTAKWVNIYEPDTFGKYTLVLYGDDAIKNMKQKENDILKTLKKELDELKVKYDGHFSIIKKDDEGNYFIRFKREPKEDTKIGVFDNRAKPITEKINIGNGSIVKVHYALVPYYMAAQKKFGVSPILLNVQILKLVEYSSAPFKDESDEFEDFLNDNQEQEGEIKSDEIPFD